MAKEFSKGFPKKFPINCLRNFQRNCRRYFKRVRLKIPDKIFLKNCRKDSYKNYRRSCESTSKGIGQINSEKNNAEELSKCVFPMEQVKEFSNKLLDELSKEFSRNLRKLFWQFLWKFLDPLVWNAFRKFHNFTKLSAFLSGSLSAISL